MHIIIIYVCGSSFPPPPLHYHQLIYSVLAWFQDAQFNLLVVGLEFLYMPQGSIQFIYFGETFKVTLVNAIYEIHKVHTT